MVRRNVNLNDDGGTATSRKKKATRRGGGKTTALAKWDEELARYAQESAEVEEGQALGQFVSLKGGLITYNDAPLPGNRMAVVILDHVLENVYYPGEYDAENPSGPDCFAFGRVMKEMAPHDDSPDAQNETCTGCPQNAWGSGRGRAKACRNTRRLAIIPAGTFDKKNEEYTLFEKPDDFGSPLAFLKLPVTSVKAYSAYVNQLSTVMKRPPFGVVTEICCVPDERRMFTLTFEVLEEVGPDLVETVVARHEEAKGAIDFPYAPMEDGGSDGTSSRKAATKSKAKAKPVRKKKF